MAKPGADVGKLAQLAVEAKGCTRCPLYLVGTQTVFGEGPVGAEIMMVGEQPGDQEDLAGRPFVGPAGGMLDRALTEAGIERTKLYVTNTVKHFKNEPRGKRRLHKRPNRDEIQKCRWWLDREIALVRPRLIVALGATAAEAMLGGKVVLARQRGQLLEFPGAGPGMVTTHPSSILRMPDQAARRQAFAALVTDLMRAQKLLEGLEKPPS
jgi:DNA polymerase